MSASCHPLRHPVAMAMACARPRALAVALCVLTPCVGTAAEITDVKKIISAITNENTRAMAVTPVFNQRVVNGLPEGWRAGAEKAERDSYTMEFMPEKENSQTWRDMIVLKGFRGLAKDPRATPKALLAQIAAELRTTCADKAITLSLGDTKVDGLDAHGAVMGCTGPPEGAVPPGGKGLGEMAFYLALRGSEDLFVLQRSKRADEFKKADAPINAANAFVFFREMQPVKLCPRDLPEVECVQRQPR